MPEQSEAASATPQSTSVGSAETSVPVRLTTFSMGGYVKALGILCLAVAALWLGLRLVRHFGKSFGPLRAGLERDALRIEGQLPLGPRRGLMVVRFKNERLLLGVTEHHISHLSSHSLDEEAIMDNQVPAKGFASILSSFSKNSSKASMPADGGSNV